MTAHAGFRRRQARVSRILYAGVAVAAVDSIVLYVMLVTEGNWLLWSHAYGSGPGATIHNVGDSERATNQQHYYRYGYLGDRVRAWSKKLCHRLTTHEPLRMQHRL